MSERNGDKARFQKNRQRKLQNRQRSRELALRVAASRSGHRSDAITRAASLAMHDEGGPTLADE